DDLDFHEVVARAERAALLGAALLGVVGDRVGVGAVEVAAGLGVVHVARFAQVALDDVARAFREQALEVLAAEGVLAGAPRPGRDVAEQGLDELPNVRLDFAVEQVGATQADAAVDVVTHAARRDY